MQKISKRFMIFAGIMLLMGTMNAFAGGKETKSAKNMGILSVKADQPYSVLVDGVEVGKAGVGAPAEFLVEPGVHKVEIINPDPKRQSFSKEMTFAKKIRNCICLTTKEIVSKRPCPYNITVDAPEAVTAGDLVTFAAFNAVGGSIPLTYSWKVTPDNARITSGLGTPSITVDTANISGPIRAELEVTDGMYDKECRQMVVNEVRVTPLEPEKPKEPVEFDEFYSVTFDDDKARLSNFATELQNRPDTQAYLIVYQGTKSKKRGVTAEKLAARALNYLVQDRGLAPNRVSTTFGGYRERTGYELWIVPPGAGTPTPSPTMNGPANF